MEPGRRGGVVNVERLLKVNEPAGQGDAMCAVTERCAVASHDAPSNLCRATYPCGALPNLSVHLASTSVPGRARNGLPRPHPSFGSRL